MSTFSPTLEAKLYLLRALVHATVLRRLFSRPDDFSALLAFLKIDEERLSDRAEFKGLLAQLRARLAKLEARWLARGSDGLDSVLGDLVLRLGLSMAERQTLRLALRCRQVDALQSALDALSSGSGVQLHSQAMLLSRVLDCDEAAAQAVLHPRGALRRGGFLADVSVFYGLGSSLQLHY